MQINIVRTGLFEVNTYVLSDEQNRAVVVDPGANPEKILRFMDSRGLSPVAYLLTHGHVDHVSALADMLDARPAPAYMHEADLEWAFNGENGMPPFYEPARKPGHEITALKGGERILDGRFQCLVIHTPGHSPGCVCYLFEAEQVLLSGDTLFKGGVGRTDLPGGDGAQLAESLRLLKGLPGALRVLPGHGPLSTIAGETAENPFLSGI